MDRGREEGEYTDYAIKRENEYIAAREEGETMDNKEGGFAQRTASGLMENGKKTEYFFVLSSAVPNTSIFPWRYAWHLYDHEDR